MLWYDKSVIAILTLIFFIFGLIVGSFLNVVICRYNTDRSLGGRSACMSCQNKLSWYELIPLFSFLALRGRCFNCQSKISAQYPLVEFITGLIFTGLFLKFQDAFFYSTFIFFVIFIYYALAFSILMVVSSYDFRHKIIPDLLVFIFGILAFIGLFFFNASGFYPHIPSLSEFLSGVLIAAPFAFIWLVSAGRAMGLGDAKLALGLGWLLGFSRVLSAAVVGVWSGAIIGLFLVFFKKYGIKSEIPFAPFLIFGAFLAFFFELHLFPIF